MRLRKLAFFTAVLGAIAAPVACVDLFHGTDFVTLCDRDPENALCGGEGGADAEVADTRAEAARPSIDFCDWSPIEARKRAERACAWLGACEGPVGDNVFGPCMMHALWAYDCDLNPTMRPAGAARALWECLVGAKTCADVDACVFGPDVTVCTAVPSGSFTACGAKPADDVLVECGRPEPGRPVGAAPCAATGRTCERLDDSTGLCTGSKKKGCTVGQSCDGTAAVDCQTLGSATVDRGFDCASFGAGTCVAKNGKVACAPQADAGACIREQLDLQCVNDGGAAYSCVGGKQVLVDCTKLGLGCDETAGAPVYDPLAACVEQDAASPCAASAADECAGTLLRSCAHGKRFDVDCTSVGLGPCEKAPSGVIARCTPP